MSEQPRLSDDELTAIEQAHLLVIQNFPHSENRVCKQVLTALTELRERRAADGKDAKVVCLSCGRQKEHCDGC